MTSTDDFRKKNARGRVRVFERQYEGSRTPHLAYHASLPVALNAEFLHMLRVNFFVNFIDPLPYTAEIDVLLSPLCREIGEDLYEIEPAVREVLLQALVETFGYSRVCEVAALLWQYMKRSAVWNDMPELERAQQLTVLNFLSPEKAAQWLSNAAGYVGRAPSVTQAWFVAMQQEINQQQKILSIAQLSLVQQTLAHAIQSAQETLDLSKKSLEILPPEVGQLTALKALDLSGNALTVIPAEVGQLVNLETLNLNDNQLQALPAEIVMLSNLKTLTLRNNLLTELTPEFRQLTTLQTLDLQGNSLDVPDAILARTDEPGFILDYCILATGTSGISPVLLKELQEVLVNCNLLHTDKSLQDVFGDERLASKRAEIPMAANTMSRVNMLVASLRDSWNMQNQNALALFLCVLAERTGDQSLRDVAEATHQALSRQKIHELAQELKQLEETVSRGWTDSKYATQRNGEYLNEIKAFLSRLKGPFCLVTEVSKVPHAAPLYEEADTYTDLEIHIMPRDVNAGLYAVVAELDGESKYFGLLQMGDAERVSLLTITDPEVYGLALFDALFTTDIYRAYMHAQERARVRTADRLRLRLWIDHEAADLHALVWERLCYRNEGGAFRVATNAKLPFSRYFGLSAGEVPPIAGPVRMLYVISSPQNLAEEGLAPLDVETEIVNLQNTLNDLRQAGMSITIMPGRTGLSVDLTRALAAAGYVVESGPTTLDRLLQSLAYAPGYHFVHFLGHGMFNQRRGQAALILEDNDGQARVVTDDDFTGRLAGLEKKPHLIFLAACESAASTANAINSFVGLAPRLVQIGIPAVVAIRDKIAMGAVQTLTKYFYRFLLQHGIVDKALNQARGFLVDTPDWDTPVLFMRLRDGRLLDPAMPIPVEEPPTPPPTADNDLYTSYEAGMRELLVKLGESHERYTDALVYRDHLIANLQNTRIQGDTAERRVERIRIIGDLNTLSLDVMGIAFNELVQVPEPAADDPYIVYETRMRELLTRMGKKHPRYSQASTIQQRLTENLQSTRTQGDTTERRAERAMIIDALNNLSLEVLGIVFNELVQVSEPATDDPYTIYEARMRELLAGLGKAHPDYTSALVYQQRLTENLQSTRTQGNTAERHIDRERILTQLNKLSLETLNIAFNSLVQASNVDKPPTSLPTADEALYTVYEARMRELSTRMGTTHERYTEALVNQLRLLENLSKARLYGDTTESRVDRARILTELNKLSLDTLGIEFGDLVQAPEVTQEALSQARQVLVILEKQAASYTALTVPASLQAELERQREEVAQLSGVDTPPNPFTDARSIRESSRFVGRDYELRRLCKMLKGGSVTLLGEPKIGKSSLIVRLAEVWQRDYGGHVLGLLDCQGMFDCTGFFEELAEVINLPPTADKRTILDALKTTSGLLFLDEVDYAVKWGLTTDDFMLFRAACNANPHFNLVTVSRSSLKNLFPDGGLGSPAYNYLLPFTLGPLTETEARALLSHPWDTAAPTFDAATVDELLALAGTHPFKLQRAAHHRYEVFGHPTYDWKTVYRDEIAQLL